MEPVTRRQIGFSMEAKTVTFHKAEVGEKALNQPVGKPLLEGTTAGSPETSKGRK